MSLIWDSGIVKRVLDEKMGAGDQMLLLLHQNPSWVDVASLAHSVEYSSVAMFRKRVLEKLHKSRHIEFDKKEDRAKISPKGTVQVEEKIIRPRIGWKK